MKILRLIAILALVPSVYAEPLPFRDAIELATKRSTVISAADQMRAHEAYLAAARMYIPQVTAGSGLAKSYGYPQGPSIANLNSTGYLINPGQRDAVRAARLEWDATAYSSEDKRQQAILDAAIAYTQLDRLVTALALLRQQEQEAMRAEQITGERVKAGIEPALELTRASLGTARVRMAITQVEGAVDAVRNSLSQLTGLPAAAIETVTESIPQIPDINPHDESAPRAASANPAVKLAFAHADAQQLRAQSEHKQLWPAIDFLGQYQLFLKYNNYTEYFTHFQYNNIAGGVVVRFAFLNMSQRARAAVADAEAVQARRQAEDTKAKASNRTRKLQHEVTEHEAAREVARLEYQLARADVDAIQTKVQAGTATLRDEANARLAEGQKYSAYLDASYQLEQTQMQLLRSTGELERWALSQPK